MEVRMLFSARSSLRTGPSEGRRSALLKSVTMGFPLTPRFASVSYTTLI